MIALGQLQPPRSIGMSFIKKLGGIAGSLGLAVATLTLTAEPAAATSTTIKICNRAASQVGIDAYKTDFSWSDYLQPGECSKSVNNTGSNPVRVDTGGSQTGSYKLRVVGGPWGQCHIHTNPVSDPPNEAAVEYQTYAVPDDNCGP